MVITDSSIIWYYRNFFLRFSYWKKPLKLHELLAEIENLEDDLQVPDGIAMLPPITANDYNTDEDSGDENVVDINNVPGSQLMAEAEAIFDHLDEDTLISDMQEPVDEEYNSEDDLPLSHFQKRLKKHKKPKQNFSWIKQDITSNLMNWEAVSGPNNSLSPLELFTLFVDEAVISMITQYTNLYASQHNCQADISADEIRCFIGILLLSGYNIFPRRGMYWETGDDAGNKLVNAAISRDRFNFIMQNIHLNDNTNLTRNDKFSKIRPLFDILNKQFHLFAPFEECHSVDESMVPYYGSHGTKQFIRGKPIRWGYKIWTGTTKRGYIEWFEPYQGSNAQGFEKYRELGLGASVVLRFADVLQNRSKEAPFHIFCDNFFTSVLLLNHLAERGLKCTGTLRENRISKCPLKHSKVFKKEPRGAYDYCLEKNTNIILCKWNDNNVVTIASNAISPLPTSQVKRFSQKEKKCIY